MKNQSGLFTRWYQELAGFNFKVIHKKGKENSNADTLSRSLHMAEAPLLEKREHSLMVSWRTQNPAGFYSEDWDEFQQEEDEWQTPDKWQRISQMVFCGGCLEINPDEAGYTYLKFLYSTPRRRM